MIENLEIRSARPPYSFTDHTGATQNYPNNAAAIYVEKGDLITIRHCVLHDCGNGLFVAAAAREVVVEGNHIHGNGNVGSIYEHNSYTAAAGITFQFNRYGPLRAGTASATTSRIAQPAPSSATTGSRAATANSTWWTPKTARPSAQDPRYRDTFVYGNVLIEPDGAGNSQIVHYGGDSGNLPDLSQRHALLPSQHRRLDARRKHHPVPTLHQRRIRRLPEQPLPRHRHRRPAGSAGRGRHAARHSQWVQTRSR